MAPAKKAKRWSDRVKTGLFLRVAGDATNRIDHAAIQPPVCTASNCKLTCCNPGYSPEQVRLARDQARAAYALGGKLRFDSYLRVFIVRGTRKRITGMEFRRLPTVDGAVKRGCTYCNTVPGDIGRNHTFRTCPRRAEGMKVAATLPVKTHQYFLPPEMDRQSRRQVSASFFKSLYQLSNKKVANLQRATVMSDVNALLARTGRQGSPQRR